MDKLRGQTENATFWDTAVNFKQEANKLVYLEDYKIYPDKFVVAVLDTMYDWRGQTSGAGYRQAPRYFRINRHNFTGNILTKIFTKMINSIRISGEYLMSCTSGL